MDFNKWNKIMGWLVFAIAFIVYALTVEPTTSFWDAGEYIATSSKLEVGHPPGAPLYQMLGAFISIFALEASQIALMVNMLSVTSSAFTILFMFWSLTLLLKRHILRDAVSPVMILGSAAVGCLTFMFTDSFWFNAVEAEVYAAAAMLMSLMFYLGLLWERDMHKPRGNRWLVLISFIVGLSFGVHFMGILTIPAIGLLWYFKHYRKVTALNFTVALASVIAVLLFVFKLLLPYTLSIFGYLEIFFVNEFGMPFDSGTIIAFVLIVALFVGLISLSRKRNFPLMNTITLCVMFVLIGFSSWVMLPIRSNAGTPINENSPKDARALLAYYNREQYPSVGLFYGESFTDRYAGLDPDNPFVDANPVYERDYDTGKYVIVNEYKNAEQNTHDDHKGWLPRMHDGTRADNYVDFMGGLNYESKPEYASYSELTMALAEIERNYDNGNMRTSDYINELLQFRDYIDFQKPTFWQNMHFMFDYQINYMYMRYFMWNFAGKQNDEQGKKDMLKGNWISGIDFIDRMNVGSQDNLPEDMKNNPGRNTYFLLPLILGLLGAIFHASKDWRSFFVTLVLFLFTGLAIIFYLNQAMFQVRERDYAYVGSFLVFSMWIGMGVYSLYDMLKDSLKPKIAGPVVLSICLLASPVLMGFQNWDDHDRSGKYTALASAKKYLDSCLPNAIIFTIGDNDTFPLWYAQEVEGYRTDVRVVCTSLLATAWYMDDMKKQAYESEPVPSTLSHDKYTYGTRDIIYRVDKDLLKRRLESAGRSMQLPDTMRIDQWMDWIASDNKITQEIMSNDQWLNTFPSKYVTIPVNKENALASGIVTPEDADKMVDEITIEINSSAIYKNEMFMMDIIAANDWKRPIYFSGGAFGDADYAWMKKYTQLDGMAYRLTPIPEGGNVDDPFAMGRIDPDYMYNVVKGWDWGNSGDPDMYHDVETRRNSISNRNNLTRLAEALIADGQIEKAEEILDLGMEKMPIDIYGHYSMLEDFVTAYYDAGADEKASRVFKQTAEKFEDRLDYFASLDFEDKRYISQDIYFDVERYRSLIRATDYYDDGDLIAPYIKRFNEYIARFSFIYSQEDTYQGSMNFDEELKSLMDVEVDNTETDTLVEQLLKDSLD